MTAETLLYIIDFPFCSDGNRMQLWLQLSLWLDRISIQWNFILMDTQLLILFRFHPDRAEVKIHLNLW